MGIVSTVKELFASPNRSTDRKGGETPKGSYWCHDCTERVPAAEAGEEPPACPACGDEMELERTPTTGGCAC